MPNKRLLPDGTPAPLRGHECMNDTGVGLDVSGQRARDRALAVLGDRVAAGTGTSFECGVHARTQEGGSTTA